MMADAGRVLSVNVGAAREFEYGGRPAGARSGRHLSPAGSRPEA